MNRLNISIAILFVSLIVSSAVDSNEIWKDFQDVIKEMKESTQEDLENILRDIDISIELNGYFTVGSRLYSDFAGSSFSYTDHLDKAIKWIQDNVGSVVDKEKQETMQAVKEDLEAAKTDLLSIHVYIEDINKAVTQQDSDNKVNGLIRDLKAKLNDKVYIKKRMDALDKANPSTSQENILNELQDVIAKIKISESNQGMDQALRKMYLDLESSFPIKSEDVVELNAEVLSYTNALNHAIKWIQENLSSIPMEDKEIVSLIKEKLEDAVQSLTEIDIQVREVFENPDKSIDSQLSLMTTIISKLYAKRTAEALMFVFLL